MKKPLRIALICVAATVVTAGLVLAGIVGVQRYLASQEPDGCPPQYVYTNGVYYIAKWREISYLNLPEGFARSGEVFAIVDTRTERAKTPQEGDGYGMAVGDGIYSSPNDPDTVYVLMQVSTEGSPRYMSFHRNDDFMTSNFSDYSVYYVYTNETRYILQEYNPIELPEGFSETSKIARMPDRFIVESAQEGDSNIYPIGSPICTSPDDPDVIYVGVEYPSRTGKGKETRYVRLDREK